MVRTSARKALVCATVVVFVAVTATGTAAAQTSGPTEIDGCTTIESSGEYALTQDIDTNAETCIEIEAGNVVLNGQGNGVNGVSMEENNSTGVDVGGDLTASVEDVTVKNLRLSGWDRGVRYSFVNDSEVRNVEVDGTEMSGVSLSGSSNVSVVDSVFDGNEEAVQLAGLFSASANNTVRDNVIEDNNGSAVSLFLSAANNTVRNNTVVNSSTGLSAVFGPTNNTFVGNTVTEGEIGAFSALAANNTYRANTVTDSQVGLLSVFSFGETYDGNTVRNNSVAGVLLINSFNNTFVGNELTGNARAVADTFYGGLDEEDTGGSGDLQVSEERGTNRFVDSDIGLSGAATGVTFSSSNFSVNAVNPGDAPGEPQGQTGVGTYFNVTDTLDATEISENVESDQAITGDLTRPFFNVTFGYDEAALQNDETSLSLWKYDAGTGWAEVPSTVDGSENTVSANVTQKGTYGLFTSEGGGGTPGNPFINSSGDALTESEAADVLFEWNTNNGVVNGQSIPKGDMADFLFDWNLAQ